jgi:hypothetical protein
MVPWITSFGRHDARHEAKRIDQQEGDSGNVCQGTKPGLRTDEPNFVRSLPCNGCIIGVEG